MANVQKLTEPLYSEFIFFKSLYNKVQKSLSIILELQQRYGNWKQETRRSGQSTEKRNWRASLSSRVLRNQRQVRTNTHSYSQLSTRVHACVCVCASKCACLPACLSVSHSFAHCNTQALFFNSLRPCLKRNIYFFSSDKYLINDTNKMKLPLIIVFVF